LHCNDFLNYDLESFIIHKDVSTIWLHDDKLYVVTNSGDLIKDGKTMMYNIKLFKRNHEYYYAIDINNKLITNDKRIKIKNKVNYIYIHDSDVVLIH